MDISFLAQRNCKLALEMFWVFFFPDYFYTFVLQQIPLGLLAYFTFYGFLALDHLIFMLLTTILLKYLII